MKEWKKDKWDGMGWDGIRLDKIDRGKEGRYYFQKGFGFMYSKIRYSRVGGW